MLVRALETDHISSVRMCALRPSTRQELHSVTSQRPESGGSVIYATSLPAVCAAKLQHGNFLVRRFSTTCHLHSGQPSTEAFIVRSRVRETHGSNLNLVTICINPLKPSGYYTYHNV